LGWLGLSLDSEANHVGQDVISTADSRVTAMVVPTDEEGMIARHSLELLEPAEMVHA